MTSDYIWPLSKSTIPNEINTLFEPTHSGYRALQLDNGYVFFACTCLKTHRLMKMNA